MAMLYHHQIYCLHGLAGRLSADVAAADTVLPVEPGVFQDSTVRAGAQIQLRDGTSQSPALTVLSIDLGASTITVDRPAGRDFLGTAPTEVHRLPRPVRKWTETPGELVACPEDPAHAIRAGSGVTLEVREPLEARIVQSTSGLVHPEAWGQPLNVAPGGTGVLEFSWPYAVTVRAIVGHAGAANEGDRFDVTSGPVPVGNLAASVAPGATVLPVLSSVAAAMRPALVCTLSEGATTNALGRVLAVDAVLNTITVASPTADTFTAAATVLATSAHTLDMPVPQSSLPVSVGGDELRGRDVPPGLPIRITYRNAGPGPAALVAIVKFLT